MAFKFGLEAVLKHRKRLEDVAQKEFVEAQRALDQCLEKIEAMYRRHDEVRIEILDAQRDGSSQKLNEVRDMEAFLGGHKIRIQAERMQARALMQVVEEKQEALIEAAKEKKILVKLKEKKFAEYKQRMAELEAKAQDDMTTTRIAWGNL